MAPSRRKKSGKKHTGRRTTASLKKGFLAAYERTGGVYLACKAIDICYATFFQWKKRDPEFLSNFESARERIGELLEQEARRRAFEGVVRPVFQGGKKVGTVREYSDQVLMFLLKGAKPEVYRENCKIQMDGNLRHSGAVQIYLPSNGRESDALINGHNRLLDADSVN